MSRFRANICLFVITFFAGIQYAFLKNIPSYVPPFLFLFLTNVIGFLFGFIILRKELHKADRKHMKCSMVLAALLLGFYVFMLLGARTLETTVISFVMASYIIFVPAIALILKRPVRKEQLAGVVLVLIGLALSMGVDLSGFRNISIGYLVIADIFFACYIVVSGKWAQSLNPSVLTLGQLFFGSLFSFVGCMLQSGGTLPPLPPDKRFWVSVLFVALCIRTIYSLGQLYAQRYVSSIQVSLIFSTEIIVTMLMAPLLSKLLGTTPEVIQGWKVAGGLVILSGVIVSDGALCRISKKDNKVE